MADKPCLQIKSPAPRQVLCRQETVRGTRPRPNVAVNGNVGCSENIWQFSDPNDSAGRQAARRRQVRGGERQHPGRNVRERMVRQRQPGERQVTCYAGNCAGVAVKLLQTVAAETQAENLFHNGNGIVSLQNGGNGGCKTWWRTGTWARQVGAGTTAGAAAERAESKRRKVAGSMAERMVQQ